ncbi:uncharacterized protein TNCV_4070281 [Trichonephila clavipes]|nr:uncharacterized protein TNCV_4070281 [Trichonephila clavipes]
MPRQKRSQVDVRNNISKKWNTTENDVSQNQSSADTAIRLRIQKLLGAVDTRRYPRAENRVWSDQEDHEERVKKDRAASTCGPHSDSFNETSRRRRSNCSTNNFQTPCRSKSYIQAPYPCTPFNTGLRRQLRLQWCQARSM